MFTSLPLRRAVAVLVAVGVLGVASYAFLGSISGLNNAGRAGAATQTVSGYAISAVNYQYNASNPNKIDGLSFTLDGPVSMAKAQLEAAGSWYGCTVDAAATATEQAVPGHADWTALTCDTRAPQATIQAQDQLSVVAHS
jgi:hypothetical protein